MKNIQLSLKKKWFEITKAGIKPEDYREITPYWCNRLLLYDGENKPVKWWTFVHNVEGCFFRKAIESNIANGKMKFKEFGKNIMTLGYPKSTDSERILTYKHDGIEVREGNQDWGAEPGVKYFVIKHGTKL